MDSLIPTIRGIIIIEVSFYLFHRIVDKRNLVSGFWATFILGLIVLYFSFSNAVSILLEHIVLSGNNFTIWDILLIFFNMFYSYWRGLNRIVEINKKHENL